MFPDPEPEPPSHPGHGPLPRHLLSDHAAIAARGRLSIAGVDVLDLVAEVGTPVFVYDEDHIRRRCEDAVAARTRSPGSAWRRAPPKKRGPGCAAMEAPLTCSDCTPTSGRRSSRWSPSRRR